MGSLTIIAGTVYGNAQHVAEQVEESLAGQGIDCSLESDPSVADFSDADALLIITSTTGQGDVPPNLEFVFSDLKDESPMLTGKPFAVAALGDSSYGDSFCGAGKQFQALLTELQADAVADMLEIDAMETLEPEKDVLEWVNTIKDKLVG
ncbi:flavodoxin [Alteromonas sp. KUL42]|uniref:flavodoxin domain-containing protein n=1 Tax=Alteromonas sp. KUL42 TaxID=2480797 RepID=UPI0007952D79|nr:flavodoxin domain-containing protein [Alteromonas sp. KUL42]KXJ58162.1 MAG: flavodoxin [Alteromonas sp. Nap_26]TAP37521.1 flavodoxin [Alteromonas sp. KUL42]GEA05940.1 flavodoxin [Alteromonas sp. KUL42]